MDSFSLNRSRLATKYLFFELLPIFLVGVALFIFIIFMFQSFKLSEYIVVYDARFSDVGKLFLYQCLGFLPTLLPVSLLFSVLLVYSRLSSDSEIVALQSIGLSPMQLSVPAIALGIIVTLISFQFSANLAPWGSRRFDQLGHELSSNRPPVTIREGVFSEGFFDLVVYANEVDETKGQLKRVFIFDERQASVPLTIVAEAGEVITKASPTGNEAFLRLQNGNVHRTEKEVYTKIDFEGFDINLIDPNNLTERRTDNTSLNLSEISEALKNSEDPKATLLLKLEWHRRLALPAGCFIFSILGLGLGFVTNRRSARSGSMVICVSIAIFYWITYAGIETLAKQGHIPPIAGAWAANLIFLSFAMRKWLRLDRAT